MPHKFPKPRATAIEKHVIAAQEAVKQAALVWGPETLAGYRHRSLQEITEAARCLAAPALRTLSEICANTSAPDAARVKAAQTILDRAYGRAPTVVALTTNAATSLTQEQLLQATRAILEGRLARAKDVTPSVAPGITPAAPLADSPSTPAHIYNTSAESARPTDPTGPGLAPPFPESTPTPTPTHAAGPTTAPALATPPPPPTPPIYPGSPLEGGGDRKGSPRPRRQKRKSQITKATPEPKPVKLTKGVARKEAAAKAAIEAALFSTNKIEVAAPTIKEARRWKKS